LEEVIMTTYEDTHTDIQTIRRNVVLTEMAHLSQAIIDLDPGEIKWHGLCRGDVITFRTVEVTSTIETYKEYRYGHIGQTRERVTNRSERILSEKTRKLWHTKARGWYWLEV